MQAQNLYFDYLINILFLLLFENNERRKIDGKNFFDHNFRNDIKTYENCTKMLLITQLVLKLITLISKK